MKLKWNLEGFLIVEEQKENEYTGPLSRGSTKCASKNKLLPPDYIASGGDRKTWLIPSK